MVNIDIGLLEATVELGYTIHALPADTTSLSFLFSKKTEILSVEADGLSDYVLDTTSSRIPLLKLTFSKLLQKGEEVDIALKYRLQLDANSIQNGFGELGLDWFWFPVHPSFNQWDLLFDLQVQVDQPIYSLFSNGQVRQKQEGLYQVTSRYPDFDINLFFIKEPMVTNSYDREVQVISAAGNSLLQDSIAQKITQALDYYKQLYGTAPTTLTAVFRPVIKKGADWGYNRIGYFVLPQPKYLGEVKRSIAHELAHIWFLNGELYENAWLTESLAEYNAMLFLRQTEGEATFSAIIREKEAHVRKAIEGGAQVPVVYGAGRKVNSQYNYLTLYDKGPLLLSELQNTIGNDKFMRLLKAAATGKHATSQDFIDELRSIADDKTADDFIVKLKSY